MAKKIAVIGAGLSGISIACLLKKKFQVRVFEKSRGVGGRMSTRKNYPYVFDHGAQYFKIKTQEFLLFTTELFKMKVIEPWSFRYAIFHKQKLEKLKIIRTTDNFFVGAPNMDSIVKYLVKQCDVRLNAQINKIVKRKKKWLLFDKNGVFQGEFDWIVLTPPAPQSASLIPKKVSFHSLIQKIRMKGCYSLLIGFSSPLKMHFDVAYIENSDIAWISCNNSKPNRKGKFSLVVNSSYTYAKKNIYKPKNKIFDELVNEAKKILKFNFSNIAFKKLHQWNFVEAVHNPGVNYFIDDKEKIGVCGDWFIKSRVEDAFISANELNRKIE